MPCTRETERCSGTNQCCRNNLTELLLFVDEFMKRHEFQYWLAYGTLLGCVRDKTLIPWDEDIDLGITLNTSVVLLRYMSEFLKVGYSYKVSIHPNTGRILCITIFCSLINALHVDLDVFEPCQDFHMGKIARSIPFPGSFFPWRCIEPVGEGELSGGTLDKHKFPIPTEPEIFLDNFYGNDWRTPKIKKWIKERLLNDVLLEKSLQLTLENMPVYEFELGRTRGTVEHE